MHDRTISYVELLLSVIVIFTIIVHETLPIPMFLPHPLRHLVDWDALRLRQPAEDKDAHDDDPGDEEEEDECAHVAEHGEECLSNEEGKEHVGANSKGEACCPCLEGEDFTGNEPTQWPP